MGCLVLCKDCFQLVTHNGGWRRRVQLFPRYSCNHGYSEFNFFQGIHINMDIGIVISISVNDQHIWQAGKSRGGKPNDANQTGAGDVIMIRSRDKLKALNLHYQSAYGEQTWQDCNLLDKLLPIKSYDPMITWSWEITWQAKTIISSLLQYPWPLNFAGL